MRHPQLLAVLACAGVLLGCLFAPQSASKSVAHAVAGMALLLGTVLVVAILAEARRHHRLCRGLTALSRPASLAGQPVRLLPGLVAPVVAGLTRPHIFCPTDLPDRLDEDELVAVVLHERHHQLERAPARLLVLAALTPLVRRMPIGRAWLEAQRARVEIAADRYALQAGASRLALAGALVKLSPRAGASWAPGFAVAADLRIAALLEEKANVWDQAAPPLAHFALPAIAFVFTCLLLYLA
jgi:hypothetical protein